MYKNFLKVLLATAAMSFAEWDGSVSVASVVNVDGVDYYKISTPEELAWFRDQVNAGQNAIKGVLTENIILGANESAVSATAFAPIGTSENVFEGVLDGAGFSITGLKSTASVGGLFGYIGSSGVVQNLKVLSAKVSHSNMGGVIAGKNAGKIINVTVSGSVDSNTATDQTGGVVGVNNGRIEQCYSSANASAQANVGGIAASNSGTIVGCTQTAKSSAFIQAYSYSHTKNYAGGIAGHNSGTISKSGNTGAVSAASSEVNSFTGGIVGENTGSIFDSYNKGSVTGYAAYTLDIAGCLVGQNSGSKALIQNSYCASSSLTGRYPKASLGALVGYNLSSAKITSCYYDVSLLPSASYLITGKNEGSMSLSAGLTTADMKKASFAWTLNTTTASNDNSKVWSSNNDYPYYADENSKPVYRLTFNDGISDDYQYSTYLGATPSPENPKADPGFTFVSWIDKDGIVFRPRNIVTEDKIYSAVFSQAGLPQYVITIMDGENSYSVVTNKNAKLTVIPSPVNVSDESVFDGWYIEGTDEKVTLETVFKKSVSIIARYTGKTYKITFLDYDGSVYAEDYWEYGKIPSVKDPIRERSDEYTYQFKGWSPSIVAVSGTASYEAKYDSKKIVFCKVIVNGDEKNFATGDKFILPEAPKKDAFSFVGWFDADGKKLGNAGDAITIERDMKIIAKYEKIENSESSSSSGKDALLAREVVPNIGVSVAGRSLRISGVSEGARIMVMDMQGRLTYAGLVYGGIQLVDVPRGGAYLVQAGSSLVRVNVK